MLLNRSLTVVGALLGLPFSVCLITPEAKGLGDYELEATQTISTDADGQIAQARFQTRLGWRERLLDRWRLDARVRLELADDETGLGTLETYSPISRPVIDEDAVRLELEQFTATRRGRGWTLTLGKQSVAWGVLDGIQITDRFDATSSRDFIFVEPRPDRIARWGARWQGGIGPIEADIALHIDPTVTQLPASGDRFEPTAPRLVAGLNRTAAAESGINFETRSAYLEDATFGLRVSQRFPRLTISGLVISGPDHEAAIASAPGTGVELRYPRRTLYGATAEWAVGPAVFRFEAAHIPNQSVNLDGAWPPEITERGRWLVGIASDFDLPNRWFANIQIGYDRIETSDIKAARPDLDLIYTLRISRRFGNNRNRVSAELIGSATDSDGVFSTGIERQVNDHLLLIAGFDVIYGSSNGLFGQFRDTDQIWVRAKFSY